MIYLKTMQENTNSIYVEVQYFPLKCINYYNFYFIKVKIYQLVILINYIFDKNIFYQNTEWNHICHNKH